MKTSLYMTLACAAIIGGQPMLLPAQNISPAAGSTILPTQAAPEGFVMVAGKVYAVRQGVATPLDREITLRVTPNGIIGFDQRPRSITSNAMMTLDGTIVAAPRSLTFVAPTPAAPAAPDPRLQDRGVYGFNLSGLAPSPAKILQAPTPRAAASNGPHNVIAKKSSAAKSSKSTASLTAKRPSAPARERAIPKPAFSDELIPLPNSRFDENGVISPNISAESTMLSVTANPGTPTTPVIPTLDASLGFGANPASDLKITAPLAPVTAPPQSEMLRLGPAAPPAASSTVKPTP